MINTTYNKLVRDNIPNIITSTGAIPNIRILNDKEYSICLRDKLVEEVKEFLAEETDNIEELVDIYEVIIAILSNNNISLKTFEEIRNKKVREKGLFKNKVFLLSVQNDC